MHDTWIFADIQYADISEMIIADTNLFCQELKVLTEIDLLLSTDVNK